MTEDFILIEKIAERLRPYGIYVNTSESDYMPDENGHIELCVMSNLDCYNETPSDEADGAEEKQYAKLLESIGLDVIADSGACWHEDKEYPPMVGDYRFIKVNVPEGWE